MAENEKCAHPACNCMATKDSKYCSAYCEDAGKTLELARNCQHAGCAEELRIEPKCGRFRTADCNSKHEMSFTKSILGLICCVTLLLLSVATGFAAEYQGKSLDGKRFSGYAQSLVTGKYYPVKVAFEGKHATVRMEGGKTVSLTLDADQIEDSEDILAADRSGAWWSLFLDAVDSSKQKSDIT